MYQRLSLFASGLALGFAALAISLAGPKAAPVSALTNCETSTAVMDANETLVFELLNTYRVQNGLPPVKVSPNLSRAAAWMTEDMTAKGYFNHFEPGGRSPFQRASDCGYPSQNVGENLAMSFSGPAAMTLWKNSTVGHNENMLKNQWKVVGIGRTGGYWAMVFGATDDSGTSGANPSPQATSTATPTATASPTPSPTPTPGPHQPSLFPIRRAMLQMVAVE